MDNSIKSTSNLALVIGSTSICVVKPEFQNVTHKTLGRIVYKTSLRSIGTIAVKDMKDGSKWLHVSLKRRMEVEIFDSGIACPNGKTSFSCLSFF